MTDADLARRAIALLDLTELGDAADEAAVEALCAKARGRGKVPQVAAVCVWPRHVRLARRLVGAQGIRIATVINFPSGEGLHDEVQAEAHEALAAGADDIDMVIPYTAFLAGDPAPAATLIARVKPMLPPSARLKIILETGAYASRGQIRTAADLAIAAGADFIKTSTGKTPQGASLEAAEAMLEAIAASSRPVGFKPSGGIRTMEDAAAYLALADRIMGPAWATAETFRFGVSGLWDALAAVIEGRDRIAGTGY